MPILAPDRNKGKIAALVMQRMAPSYAEKMRMGSEQNLANMANAETEERESEDTVQAGAMALRAMFSAINDGDYEAAYRAYENLHRICDANLGEDY